MTEPERRRHRIRHARAGSGRGGRPGAAARAAGGWLLAVLVAGGAPAHAVADCWRIDPRDSEVRFHLVALGAIHLHGRFERLSGRALRSEGDDRIQVRVEVDAGSLTMASARYQAWARSPEFFDVQRHPRVLFESEPLPLALLEDGGELAGRLTVRGIERPVRFELRAPACTEPYLHCRLHVQGEIRRAEFGMRSRRITLSDRVALDLHLRVERDPAACLDAASGAGRAPLPPAG